VPCSRVITRAWGRTHRRPVGDVLPVPLAGGGALLDLDAARPAGGEAVDDVARAAAVQFVAGLRDAHRDPGAGYRPPDGIGDLPLQGVGRGASYEDTLPAETVEGDGVPEAPSDVTRPSFGKLAGWMPVEVMCQRSWAPPPRFQPSHRHELAPLGESRSAMRSACRSVQGSICPPWGR
jgi:hypothetical protein